MRLCEFPECGRKHLKGGLCDAHNLQKRRGVKLRPIATRPGRQAMPIHLRFWEKVRIEGGQRCWEWTGTLTRGPKGYGSFGVARGHTVRAHRYAWELTFKKKVPAGLYVCHRCDNPRCVRHDHLFLGTAQDNIDDAVSKGRIKRRAKSVA